MARPRMTAWVAAASYSVLGFRVTSNGRVYELSSGGGFPGNSGIAPARASARDRERRESQLDLYQ